MMNLIKIILLLVIVSLILITGLFQYIAEKELDENRLETLNIDIQIRKRYSFYLFYELDRMIDIDFQRNEIDYVNCYFKGRQIDYWDSRFDYYIMHLYHTNHEKDSIKNTCKGGVE